MQAVARLEQVRSRNRRTAERRKLRLGATLASKGDPALIRDMSTTGMLIDTRAELATFEQIQVELPEIGEVVATIMWNSGHYFGCEFHQPIPAAALSAALLRSPFAEEPAAPIPAAQDESAHDADLADDRYPFAVRLRVILAASLLLWSLILCVAGVLWNASN